MQITFTDQELQNYKEVKRLYNTISQEITESKKYQAGNAIARAKAINKAISKEVNSRGYDYKSWQATSLKIARLNDIDRKSTKNT